MTAAPNVPRRPDGPSRQDAQLAAVRAKWLAPRTAPQRFASNLGIAFIKALTRAFVRLEVSGQDHLPTHGPVLICPNHSSLLDPLVMVTALSFGQHRRTTWSGDVATTFGNGFLRTFCWLVGVFPLDRRAPRIGLRLATEVLDRGEMLVWMPEGYRSPNGQLLPFRSGVGTLIRDTRAPVVPVRIIGVYEAWPRGQRLPRLFRKVTVVFAPPIPAKALIDDAGGPDARAKPVAEALRRRYLALGEGGGDRG